ncbi:hypothetical protein DPM19_09610 [Actinomadura craniellae]|uniref:Uncharacterized protein n=1 Tax=Actinomadura craniellae TaxID=2231787 RepID=A0A365H7D9_9ACTN|nr:hypothetical protein [Actinomadura craniellae]RAY14997.1 hypothetical protein DPM19_09610 [Actinomadura craniellae]
MTGRHPTITPASYFPLVPRPRPSCVPLTTRIDRLRALAAEPGTGDLHQQLIRAAEVCNLAALIASDCGLNTLARDLCRRQYDVFEQARPLPDDVVPLALQPLLNIPRQMIRDGDGSGAYATLEALHRAARTQSGTVVAGRKVRLRDLARSVEGHKALTARVWAALLADGTRALVQVGRWTDAAERIAAHRGIGTRLLDGRQVTILAAAHTGRHEQAAELIDHSSVHEPWEHAVQHLLRAHCQKSAGTDVQRHLPAMIASTLALLKQTDPGTTVFRSRAAITVLDLTRTHYSPEREELTRTLIEAAGHDGYAARDLLARPYLTYEQCQVLVKLVRICGLDAGVILEPLHGHLMTAARCGEQRLRALLNVESGFS